MSCCQPEIKLKTSFNFTKVPVHLHIAGCFFSAGWDTIYLELPIFATMKPALIWTHTEIVT